MKILFIFSFLLFFGVTESSAQWGGVGFSVDKMTDAPKFNATQSVISSKKNTYAIELVCTEEKSEYEISTHKNKMPLNISYDIQFVGCGFGGSCKPSDIAAAEILGWNKPIQYKPFRFRVDNNLVQNARMIRKYTNGGVAQLPYPLPQKTFTVDGIFMDDVAEFNFETLPKNMKDFCSIPGLKKEKQRKLEKDEQKEREKQDELKRIKEKEEWAKEDELRRIGELSKYKERVWGCYYRLEDIQKKLGTKLNKLQVYNRLKVINFRSLNDTEFQHKTIEMCDKEILDFHKFGLEG